MRYPSISSDNMEDPKAWWIPYEEGAVSLFIFEIKLTSDFLLDSSLAMPLNIVHASKHITSSKLQQDMTLNSWYLLMKVLRTDKQHIMGMHG
jgi:hypothetical protein